MIADYPELELMGHVQDPTWLPYLQGKTMRVHLLGLVPYLWHRAYEPPSYPSGKGVDQAAEHNARALLFYAMYRAWIREYIFSHTCETRYFLTSI